MMRCAFAIVVLQSPNDLRNPHSYPTRRSSDLCRNAFCVRRWGAVLHLRDEGRRRYPRGRCEERSEEHTSELQSQSNLVCRLLLEKKNLLAVADDVRGRCERRHARAESPIELAA